jgi:hypothetical protein
MTANEILTQLESLGDDARRKHNAKAGAPDNQFGVKLGDIWPVSKGCTPAYVPVWVEAMVKRQG